MSTSRHRTVTPALAGALLFVIAPAPQGSASAAPAPGPGLGRQITEDQIRRLDLTVSPDGAGLPEGGGDAARGAVVYGEQCKACHGEGGRGGVGAMPRLTGGLGSLNTKQPVKTVNSFWPYATGVFDYIRRSMPPTRPQSLSVDDTYAVTAYLLSVDGIVGHQVLDAKSLPEVRMPNRDGFIPWWPTPPR